MFYRFPARKANFKKAALAAVVFAVGFANPVFADTSDLAIIDKNSRIIGGSTSKAGEFPFMAALVKNGSGSLFNRQFCGGSIINEKWILSAAHCFFDSNDNVVASNTFKVVTGINSLTTTGATEYAVTNIHVHPGYVNSAVGSPDDIALLELEFPLQLTEGVEVLALYGDSGNDISGANSTAIGWGAVNYDDPSNPGFPTELQHVNLPLVSLEVCNAPASYNGSLQDWQVCAGLARGGIDSCVGDSGGPLVIKINGFEAQVGVVSFGAGCAMPNGYGVYTNVGYYTSWIQGYIDGIGTIRASAGSPEVFIDEDPFALGATWFMLAPMAGLFLRRLYSRRIL